MKKYIVSLFLITTFGVYALYEYVAGNIYSVAVVSPVLPETSSAPTTSSILPTDTSTAPPPPPPTIHSTPVQISAPQIAQPAPASAITSNQGQYKNGQYTGPTVDAYYGNVQIAVTITGGEISDVTFLDYPHDRSTSERINTQAMPYLKQEAIQAQSANVNIVSGATDTSDAFKKSLASALAQAANS